MLKLGHFFISRDFQKLTLDVIACCAFGIDTNSVKDPTSIFLAKCRGILQQSENLSVIGKTLFSLLCECVINQLLVLLSKPSKHF